VSQLVIGELVGFVDLDNKRFKDGLDDSETAFERFGSGLNTAAVGVGTAAGAALLAGFMQELEFEKTNDLMAAQLRLTEDESERAGAVAGELYADAYGANIGEVNDALRGIIAQTGELGDITDDELTAMGAKALDLAAILGTDVSRVVQVAGQAVRNGLAVDMTEAFDLIAAASAETMPGLQEDLLDAVDEYGVFFSQLGIDGPAAFGLLAKGSEQGMYGIDKAGDAVKEFTILSTDMSESSKTAYEAIGLDAEEMAGKILAGGETARGAFDQIIDGLLGMEDPVAQQTAALALFGTPLEDLSTAQIPEFLAALDTSETALQDVGGAADEMGATLNDNASTGFEELKRAAMDSLASAMEPMIPILEKILEVIDPIAPVLGILAVALGIASLATMVFNAALWANPIVWIIAAVIALIAGIWLLVENWDSVSAALGTSWEWIKEQFRLGGQIIDQIIQSLVDWWSNAVDNILHWLVELGILPEKAAEWFGGLKDAAVEKTLQLYEWIKGLPSMILDALGDLGSYLYDHGKDTIMGLLEGMQAQHDAVLDWIYGLLGDVSDSVKEFFGISSPSKLMYGFGENVGEGLALGIQSTLGKVALSADVLSEAALPDGITGTAGGFGASGGAVEFSATDRELLNRVASSMGRIDITQHGPTKADIDRVYARGGAS
jgi:phage-related minor tail protein